MGTKQKKHVISAALAFFMLVAVPGSLLGGVRADDGFDAYYTARLNEMEAALIGTYHDIVREDAETGSMESLFNALIIEDPAIMLRTDVAPASITVNVIELHTGNPVPNALTVFSASERYFSTPDGVVFNEEQSYALMSAAPRTDGDGQAHLSDIFFASHGSFDGPATPDTGDANDAATHNLMCLGGYAQLGTVNNYNLDGFLFALIIEDQVGHNIDDLTWVAGEGHYTGTLPPGSLRPNTISITLEDTDTPETFPVVDDGQGTLILQGVGVPVGSIDYTNGTLTIIWVDDNINNAVADYQYADLEDLDEYSGAVHLTDIADLDPVYDEYVGLGDIFTGRIISAYAATTDGAALAEDIFNAAGWEGILEMYGVNHWAVNYNEILSLVPIITDNFDWPEETWGGDNIDLFDFGHLEVSPVLGREQTINYRDGTTVTEHSSTFVNLGFWPDYNGGPELDWVHMPVFSIDIYHPDYQDGQLDTTVWPCLVNPHHEITLYVSPDEAPTTTPMVPPPPDDGGEPPPDDGGNQPPGGGNQPPGGGNQPPAGGGNQPPDNEGDLPPRLPSGDDADLPEPTEPEEEYVFLSVCAESIGMGKIVDSEPVYVGDGATAFAVLDDYARSSEDVFWERHDGNLVINTVAPISADPNSGWHPFLTSDQRHKIKETSIIESGEHLLWRFDYTGPELAGITLFTGSYEYWRYYPPGPMEILGMDVTPFIKSGRMLVPMRFVAEEFDMEAKWTTNNHGLVDKVTFTRKLEGGHAWIKPNDVVSIHVEIGNPEITINTVDNQQYIIESDVAPLIAYPGRTMIPLRVMGESLGAEFNWGPKDDLTSWVSYYFRIRS